jgi:hypothetical protein
MHLVATTEVTAAGPRWHAPGLRPLIVPDHTRAIAIGLERSTVIVIESRDGMRTTPGEVLRLRHVGIVRLLASDGLVLARRRLATTTSGTGEALIAHLLDEVRVAVAAAPHLVVGLVQDAGDSTWHALEAGLTALRAEGAITGWCEAIDRGALRARLERTLAVIEPCSFAREERLEHWEACFDAWDDAIDGVLTFLAEHRDRATVPSAVDAQLAYLVEHRDRMRYSALHRAGLSLRGGEAAMMPLRARVVRE